MTAVVGGMDELLEYMLPEERALLDIDLREIDRARRSAGEPVSPHWRERITSTFPSYVTKPFAERHEKLWTWVNAIELDSAPEPYVAPWPRGGGKSTSGETLTADLGCRDKRRFALYVSETQEQADKHVAAVAAMLESSQVERFYPHHAHRALNKFGSSKGWRREQLRTAGGFTVEAMGLDTAGRGVKMEEYRPDLIVFDDIDGLNDTPDATAKKENTITKSILPAGAPNCAVVFLQNLIIRNGIASRLVKGKADYLANRIISGPHPAVEGLKYEWQLDERTGIKRAVITGGRATWEGFTLEDSQRAITTWGLSAFLKEAQHEVFGRVAGVVLRFDRGRHVRAQLTREAVIALASKPSTRFVAGVDPQWYRFGFVLYMILSTGVVIRVAEFLSQEESTSVRAWRIHNICLDLGIEAPTHTRVPLWGDSANPQDLAELNKAFIDGWEEVDDRERPTGHVVRSKLRVRGVGHEAKVRRAAVTRINDMLDAERLLFMPEPFGMIDPWRLGVSKENPGTEMSGSRLLWEFENWAVPAVKEGEAQDENPDDDTADGADCVACSRYAIVSHFRPGKEEPDPEVYEDDRAWAFDHKQRKHVEPRHLADVFQDTPRTRPPVRSPRPRVGR